MLTKFNGNIYTDLVLNGIKNVEKHRTALNELNVFPVPDGDTGTNMLMTLRHAYEAVKNQPEGLFDAAQRFSSAAVFGARGNSGVIVSQFFKGMAEAFKGEETGDVSLLAKALQKGCDSAYTAVSKPVEGTMLTVLKDAANAVSEAMPLPDVESLIDVYLDAARISLKNTPELLPILKKSNVVDSGGCGIVYFFEGVKKYLNGEKIELFNDEEKELDVPSNIDFSKINKNTDFAYGYCFEGLLQLKVDNRDFSHSDFKKELEQMGNSIVTSLENDKVKLHIHTMNPGNVFNYCQKFGELLTVKIENMTVQNLQNQKENGEKLLYSDKPTQYEFAVVAVAANYKMQKTFFDMGADVVIMSEITPSSQDFIDAFSHVASKYILVFPNSSNSILSAMQAASLYKKARVTVLNSRSAADCYAALPVMDFEVSVDEAVAQVNNTISSLRSVSLYQANKEIKCGRKLISQKDFFALEKKSVLTIGKELDIVALRTILRICKEDEYAVITLFYGDQVSEEFIQNLLSNLMKEGIEAEIATVSTMENGYHIIMTFE